MPWAWCCKWCFAVLADMQIYTVWCVSVTWRCSRLIRLLMCEIISTSFGPEEWWCFCVTLFSHSKWCSKVLKPAWSWESVGFNCKKKREKCSITLGTFKFITKLLHFCFYNHNDIFSYFKLCIKFCKHATSVHSQTVKGGVRVCKIKRLIDHKADRLWLEVYLQCAEVIGSAIDGWKRLEPMLVDHRFTLVVILK